MTDWLSVSLLKGLKGRTELGLPPHMSECEWESLGSQREASLASALPGLLLSVSTFVLRTSSQSCAACLCTLFRSIPNAGQVVLPCPLA